MPWSPPQDAGPGGEPSHPALEFGDRAGRLLDADAPGALIFLAVETHWERVGGHLWWSRWSAPREVIRAVLQDEAGRATSWVISGEDLETAYRDWRAGTFRHGGQTRPVVWLDQEDSARIREELLGPQ